MIDASEALQYMDEVNEKLKYEYLAKLEAENARLREALELIANGEYELPDGSCQDIARAALGKE
jgi:hypothetical protein